MQHIPAWTRFIGEHQLGSLTVKSAHELVEVDLPRSDHSYVEGRFRAKSLRMGDSDRVLVHIQSNEISSTLCHG
jgi:hypothetical protein